MRSKTLMGQKTHVPFKSKKTSQGMGKNSKPKAGKKRYRGQGK